MKVYLVTDADFEVLRKDIERVKLERIGSAGRTEQEPDPYRVYNFRIVQWYQAIQRREKL